LKKEGAYCIDFVAHNLNKKLEKFFEIGLKRHMGDYQEAPGKDG